VHELWHNSKDGSTTFEIRAVRFGFADKRLATAGGDVVKIWDVEAGELLREIPHTSSVEPENATWTGSSVYTTPFLILHILTYPPAHPRPSLPPSHQLRGLPAAEGLPQAEEVNTKYACGKSKAQLLAQLKKPTDLPRMGQSLWAQLCSLLTRRFVL
jgi:hypothetical protein